MVEEPTEPEERWNEVCALSSAVLALASFYADALILPGIAALTLAFVEVVVREPLEAGTTAASGVMFELEEPDDFLSPLSR